MKKALVFVFLAILFQYGQSKCEKSIYILPLLTGKTNCDYSSSGCAGFVRNFVKSCNLKVTNGHRTQMKFLLPSYTQFTDCFIGTKGDCDKVELAESDVVLQPYPEYYSIDKDLGRLLKTDFDPKCTDDSVFLILTDVERSDLGYYPNVERLFRSNLNQTINNFNSRYFLHTVVIWLSSNMSNSNNWPPQVFIDYWNNFSNATDFLELRLVDYTDLESYSDICDATFPQIRKTSPISFKSIFQGQIREHKKRSIVRQRLQKAFRKPKVKTGRRVHKNLYKKTRTNRRRKAKNLQNKSAQTLLHG